MIKAIYKITNVLNGKCYIGQSVDPNKRFVSHCSRANNDSDNSPIHAAIKKYGKENFELEILEWTEDYNRREKELIQEYNSLSPNGYNIALGGENPPVHYGEKHHGSVITNEEVNMVICLLKYSDKTEPEIGRWFKKNFNQPLIHNINFGITHRRKNEDYPIRNYKVSELINRLHHNGYKINYDKTINDDDYLSLQNKIIDCLNEKNKKIIITKQDNKIKIF